MVRLMRRLVAAVAFAAVLLAVASPVLCAEGSRAGCCGARCRCDQRETVVRCGCGRSPASSAAAPIVTDPAVVPDAPSSMTSGDSPSALSGTVPRLFDAAPAPPDPPPRHDA